MGAGGRGGGPGAADPDSEAACAPAPPRILILQAATGPAGRARPSWSKPRLLGLKQPVHREQVFWASRMGDRALVDEVNSKRRAVEAKMEALELEWEELELML